MKAPLKKLCIFSLSAAIGEKLMNESKDIQIKIHGKLLADFGKIAVKNCHVKVDMSKLKISAQKIYEVCGGTDLDASEMLSFLICGLHDLLVFCKDTRIIDMIFKRACAFVRYLSVESDSDVHVSAHKKYIEWIK